METALVILAAIAAIVAAALYRHVRSGVYCTMGIVVLATTIGLFIIGSHLEMNLVWKTRYYLDAFDPFGFKRILLVGLGLAFGLVVGIVLRQSDPEVSD